MPNNVQLLDIVCITLPLDEVKVCIFGFVFAFCTLASLAQPQLLSDLSQIPVFPPQYQLETLSSGVLPCTVIKILWIEY